MMVMAQMVPRPVDARRRAQQGYRAPRTAQDSGKEQQAMKVIRVYTGDDGQSHFEDLDIPQLPTAHGSLSELVPANGVIFRTTPEGTYLDFHPAPRRQFVVTLTGGVEVETGDGSKRLFGPGDVLLADDTSGQGHTSREIDGPRNSLFLPLDEGVDVAAWRSPA
jgi:hypothetical protein